MRSPAAISRSALHTAITRRSVAQRIGRAGIIAPLSTASAPALPPPQNRPIKKLVEKKSTKNTAIAKV